MVDIESYAWVVKTTGEMKVKCNNCDSDRQLIYISPRGVKQGEACKCNQREINHTPVYVYLCSSNSSNDGSPIQRYYRRKDCNIYYSTENIYKGNPFEEIKLYEVIFLDKEKCQEYCDWLKKQNRR